MIRRKGPGKLFERIEDLLRHFEGAVLVAFIVVALLSAIAGYRYYRYSEDDPQFCASCHVMTSAYREWEKGRHSDIVCQQCHKLSILEKNRLLITYVVKGSGQSGQMHGREKPWHSCRDCHMGPQDTIKKSDGHARHVFIEREQCQVCHKPALHRFEATDSLCLNCHKYTRIHGLGPGPVPCSRCHSFSDKRPPMIPSGECVKCHTGIARRGPMSGLPCHKCHNPHSRSNPTAVTCSAECHQNEAVEGRHALHLRKGLDCMYCHKPHAWVLGSAAARAVCGKCHGPVDPGRFVK